MIVRHLTQSLNRKYDPVRVCIFVDNMRSAGTEMRLRRLIESYDRNKVVPFLCLLDGEDESSRNLEPKNCEILRLGVRKILRFSTFGRLRTLYSFLRENRIDVLELYFRDCTAVGTPVGRLAGARCVTTFFSQGYWMTWLDRLMFFVYRPLISNMISNCEAAAKAGQKIAFASRKNSVILANGIDLEKFPNHSADKLLQTSPCKIGMVANLRPVKNPMMLVEAAKIIIKNGVQAEFSIVGDGPLRSSLEEAIRRAGLQDCFKLPGRSREIEKYLETLDICTLCSDSEGMSNSLIEYLAAGRATIATNVGGNSEVIEHEKNGLLLKNNTAEDLAHAIMGLIDAPDTARKLAAEGREKAFREYGIESMTKSFENFYEGLKRN